jgi:hypothetical protein
MEFWQGVHFCVFCPHAQIDMRIDKCKLFINISLIAFLRSRSIFSSIALHAQLLKARDGPIGHSLFCKLRNEGLADEQVICYTDGSCINNGKAETVVSRCLNF